jgi:hypothetical protein
MKTQSFSELKTHLKEKMSTLYCLRLPNKVIGTVIAEFTRWAYNNGLVYACERIKSLKVDYIRHLAGLDHVSGVRRSQKNPNLPYGPFCYLFKVKNRESQVISLLNLYTFFDHPIEDKDVEEATKNILYRPTKTVEDIFYEDNKKVAYHITYADLMKRYGIVEIVTEPEPLLVNFRPISKSCPGFPYRVHYDVEYGNHLSQVYRMFAKQRIFGNDYPELDIFMYKINKRFLMNIPNVTPVLQAFELGIRPGRIVMDKLPTCHVSGQVNFISAGGKKRYVACPYRYMQGLTKPLGDFIYNALRKLPWDYTFNQLEAIPKIIDQLKQGTRAYCFDLSKATDNIPLDLQISVLQSILPVQYHPHIAIWKVMSEGLWEWKERPYQSVRWGRGQPLGLYPSFGAFALWHGVHVLSLLGRKYSGEFFILGDDIVITDAKLALKYRESLQRLNIPISASKTIDSTSIAEFAGQVITPNRVIPVVKWNFLRDNILQVGRLLGPAVLPYLDKESRRLLRAFGDLPEPFGCNWFSSLGFDKKVFICEHLKTDDMLSFGDPELLLRKHLSNITKDLLTDDVSEVLRRIIDDTNSRQGFAIPATFNRALVKGRAFQPIFDKNKIKAKAVPNSALSEKDWLRSMYDVQLHLRSKLGP